MLLSLVGEPDRLTHQGAEVAIALVSQPERSVVLRTLWRVKDKKSPPGCGINKRPDFQELLTDTRISVWVRQGENEHAEVPLIYRLSSAMANPESLNRFGGLSLGESTQLVDEVRPWRASDPARGRLLLSTEEGDLSLPIWPDHVGSKGTRWGQFKLEQCESLKTKPPDQAWVTIQPLEVA
jgi:CRISPR-associated protein Cas5t